MSRYSEIVEEFFFIDDDAKFWGSDPDQFADAPDCNVMAERFKHFLGVRGIESRVVKVMVRAEDECTDVHYFTVTSEGVAFDWTARQFHNLEGMPLAYDQIPCPLAFIWPGPYPLPTIYELEVL